jgi:lysozyme family protein
MTNTVSIVEKYTALWQGCKVQSNLLPELEKITEKLSYDRGFYEKIEWQYPNLPWYWAGILHTMANFEGSTEFLERVTRKLSTIQGEQIPAKLSARLLAFDAFNDFQGKDEQGITSFVWAGTNYTKTIDSAPGCAAILYFLQAIGLKDEQIEQGQFNLKVTSDTVFKSCSLPSSKVPASEKANVKAGMPLQVIEVAIADVQHLRVTLKTPIQDRRVWFVYGGHVQIDGSQIAAVPTKPKTLAEKVVAYCEKKSYKINKEPGHKNIVYIEGMNPDGTLNNNALNAWNDLRTVIEFKDGKPVMSGCWEATTQPGKYYTYNPMNAKGAAMIAFGQYTAWQVGIHLNSHEALVQCAPVTVHRDANRSGTRDTGDPIDSGLFGINQHWGGDNPKSDIGRWSAGCQVGRTKQGHREFMAIIKSDPRYQANRNFMFTTTIIDGKDLLAQFPAS